ncbi:restriction endonuclease subunit S [Paenibacillus arenosi]|nr:restriction endonuclease subunit S [Paenibacillus arenosi]
MDREHANIRILESMADMQWNIAIMLEAKTLEAEKVRNWLLNHMIASDSADAHEQTKDALDVHAQVIEVIAGLTRLQQSLNRNMQTILDPDGQDEQGAGHANNGGFKGQLDLDEMT